MTMQASDFRRINTTQVMPTLTPLHLADGFYASIADTESVWVLRDAWTTHNGSWQDSQQNYGFNVPAWARARYLLPFGHPCYFDDAGADHHILGAALPKNWQGETAGCDLLKGANIVFELASINETKMLPVKASSGWANLPMYAGNVYNWRKFGFADVLSGAVMPGNWHVSWFAVWQEMSWGEYKTLFMDIAPPVVTPPPTEGPYTPLADQLQRLGIMAANMGVALVELADTLRRKDG